MRAVPRSPRTGPCGRLVLLVVVFGSPSPLAAQHTADHVQPQPAPTAATENAPPSLFRLREASGTAWLPDETPMLGVMRPWGNWEVMLDGNVFGQVLVEPGDRHRTGGVESVQLSSANWGMAMARRRAGAGRLGVRAMLTAEPWTAGHCGFVNLLASGEMCEGDTIHDRQHPHDLFMELAMDYDRPVRGELRWQIYAGLSGEPALGPAGFPHRPSALPNPIAPITHHWLDASHITFGLVTTGLYQPRWKAEMSVFNGREPDARRANVDLAAPDSVSGRFSVMLTPRLVFQISTGHLRDAEAEFPPQPRSSVTRTTASATYHRILSSTALWATTLAYGVNAGPEVIAGRQFDLTTHAALLESALTLGERHTWFSRAELVGKPAHDLHAHEFGSAVFTVAKLEAGYVRHLGRWRQLTHGVGGMVSANLVPEALASRYGGRVAPGLAIFVNVRPPRHSM